jgi:hypothetical protein
VIQKLSPLARVFEDVVIKDQTEMGNESSLDVCIKHTKKPPISLKFSGFLWSQRKESNLQLAHYEFEKDHFIWYQ